ncbi:MAG: RNA polymerase sigma factor [Clostridiales bacterium]|nr:RNA polymerase sigma factor [Clostridiales bacterium]
MAVRNDGGYAVFEELFRRHKEGDPYAFSDIYEFTRSAVENNIRKYIFRSLSANGSFGFSADFTEEVMQETYLALYLNIRSIKEPRTVIPWLKKTSYNLCCRISGSYIESDRMEEVTEDNSGYFENDFDSEAEFRRIAGNILPPKKYEALRLNVVEGYDYSEIAKLMHCPEGTVKSRLNSARKILAENDHGLAA